MEDKIKRLVKDLMYHRLCEIGTNLKYYKEDVEKDEDNADVIIDYCLEILEILGEKWTI